MAMANWWNFWSRSACMRGYVSTSGGRVKEAGAALGEDPDAGDGQLLPPLEVRAVGEDVEAVALELAQERQVDVGPDLGDEQAGAVASVEAGAGGGDEGADAGGELGLCAGEGRAVAAGEDVGGIDPVRAQQV